MLFLDLVPHVKRDSILLMEYAHHFQKMQIVRVTTCILEIAIIAGGVMWLMVAYVSQRLKFRLILLALQEPT
jgi:hypothetical protein